MKQTRLKFCYFLLSTLICTTVANAQVKPQFNSELSARLEESRKVIQRRQAEDLQDRQDASVPGKRRVLVSTLIATLQSKTVPPEKVLRAMLRLINIGAVEGAPALADKMDFRVQEDALFLATRLELPPLAHIYPAVFSLIKLGKPAIPAVVTAIATERSEEFTSNGIYTLYSITNHGNLAVVYLLNGYSSEYQIKFQRLHILEQEMKTAPLLIPNIATNLLSKTEKTEQNVSGRLERSLELQALVTDPTIAPEQQMQVAVAVEELGRLGDAQAVPVLADKLDPEARSAITEDKLTEPLRASPQGLLSPAIAQAAAQALVQIGKPALPALADAVATRGRSAQFQERAVQLIVQIAGDKEAAQQVLSQAAQENQRKAERLRALAASLPQAN